MRKLILHNKNKTSSIDLTSNILFTDVRGLGTKYVLKDLNKKTFGAEYSFENIILKLYFGVSGNAYTDYSTLMAFIGENGENYFVLQYTVNSKTRYCDVWLENAPKSQKDIFNVLEEDFVFRRETPWYEDIIHILNKNESVNIVNTQNLPYSMALETLLESSFTGSLIQVRHVTTLDVLREISIGHTLSNSYLGIKLDSDKKNIRFTDYPSVAMSSVVSTNSWRITLGAGSYNARILIESQTVGDIDFNHSYVQITTPASVKSFAECGAYLDETYYSSGGYGYEGLVFPNLVSGGSQIFFVFMYNQTTPLDISGVYSLPADSKNYAINLGTPSINGYPSVDKSKATFLVLDKGSYNIFIPNDSNLRRTKISYRKWVID